jgi:dienelactone hydrolase
MGVVLQEWQGLVGHIRACDRFAEGFTALAPDMRHSSGTATEAPDGAGKLTSWRFNIAQAERGLRGAATPLLGQSSTKKLGAVGCLPGAGALRRHVGQIGVRVRVVSTGSIRT